MGMGLQSFSSANVDRLVVCSVDHVGIKYMIDLAIKVTGCQTSAASVRGISHCHFEGLFLGDCYALWCHEW